MYTYDYVLFEQFDVPHLQYVTVVVLVRVQLVEVVLLLFVLLVVLLVVLTAVLYQVVTVSLTERLIWYAHTYSDC